MSGTPKSFYIGLRVELRDRNVFNEDEMKILVRSTCGKEFADDVIKLLLPNRLAIVAEVAEEWTTPVDIHMERIGGIVFRWTLSEADRRSHPSSSLGQD